MQTEILPYVELDRKFQDFDETEDQDSAVAASLRRHFSKDDKSWADLLADRFVVVLGEAGTGKTREFKERARALDAGLAPAFFIPLEDLADDRLEVDVEARLEQWRASNNDGTFFLDSVDEARLTHPAAYRRALQKLVRILGPNGTRARVVVSCRVSDWQYRTDLGTMKEALWPLMRVDVEGDKTDIERPLASGSLVAPETLGPFQIPHTDERPEVKIRLVRMAPLDDAQIAQLANAWGVRDTAPFVAALEDGDLVD